MSCYINTYIEAMTGELKRLPAKLKAEILKHQAGTIPVTRQMHDGLYQMDASGVEQLLAEKESIHGIRYVYVSVVDNGAFEAAAIGYSPFELNRQHNPADKRPVQRLLIPLVIVDRIADPEWLIIGGRPGFRYDVTSRYRDDLVELPVANRRLK